MTHIQANVTPLISNIELTALCNYDCPICVSKRDVSGHMTADTMYRIIEANRPLLKDQRIWLHHRGEPLMTPRLEEFITALSAAGAKCRFSTNGVLLTEKRAESLLSTPIDAIVVSAITNIPGDYLKLRGRDNLSLIQKNIAVLQGMAKASGSRTKLQAMCLDYGQSKKDISEFVGYYHSLSMEVSVHSYSSRVGGSRFSPHVSGECGKGQRRAVCHWPFSKLVILYDAGVTMCCYDMSAKLRLGNLRDYGYSIMEFWNSRQYSEVRKKHAELRLDGPCTECSDWVYENPNFPPERPYVHIFPPGTRYE